MNFATVAVKNVGRNVFRASLTILGVAVAMLAFVLLTLGKGARPGFLNILFKPSFLVTLLLSTNPNR